MNFRCFLLKLLTTPRCCAILNNLSISVQLEKKALLTIPVTEVWTEKHDLCFSFSADASILYFFVCVFTHLSLYKYNKHHKGNLSKKEKLQL